MTAPKRTLSSTNASFPEYLDFQKLREKGIEHCQSLASDLWTDFNLHDPGLTILEVLCYALTDLGYRTNLPFQDLIARNPNPEKGSKDENSGNGGKATDDNFFTVEQILTCNPVTLLDFRKLLIDVPGVRNAWIRPAEWSGPEIYLNQSEGKLQYEKPSLQGNTTGQIADLQAGSDGIQVKPDGMYVVYLELEDGLSDTQKEDVKQHAKKVAHRHRNLCEDFNDFSILKDEYIAICADIEIDTSANPPDVLLAIHGELIEFLSPTLKFYSLKEMLQKGKRIEDIYAGRPIAPLAGLLDPDDGKTSHGFIDVDELESIQPRSSLHTSDLYRILMDVPGVLAVRDLQIVNYVKGVSRSCGEKWSLNLTPNCRQLFDLDRSKITFYKQQFPLVVSETQKRVAKESFEKTRKVGAKALLPNQLLNLEVPEGQFRKELADYQSIVHEFPKEYGIGENGVGYGNEEYGVGYGFGEELHPENALERRKAQARQLQAYLIFYDQIMANYLAQLANVRRLFSMDNQDRTYFTQRLSDNPSVGIPQIADLIKNFNCCPNEKDYPSEPENYCDYLNFVVENPSEFAARRHLFLDHLLARFAESFTDYVMLMFNINGQRNDDEQILAAKSQFLLSYPETSRNRGKAFDYSNQPIWDSDNVSGLENRVRKLLGIGMSNGVNSKNIHARSTLGNASTIKLVNKTHWSVEVVTSHYETSLTLISRLGYDSAKEAEIAFEVFCKLAADESNYRRLRYSDSTSYAINVLDSGNEGERSVLAKSPFFLPSDDDGGDRFREKALSEVVDFFSKCRNGDVDVEIQGVERSQYRFECSANIPSLGTIKFQSETVYPSEESAGAAASLFGELAGRRKHCTLVTQSGFFLHYGFSIVDSMGTVLAEPERLFSTPQERDLYYSKLLQSAICGQVQCEYFHKEEKRYYYQLPGENGEILFESFQGYVSEEVARQAFEQEFLPLAGDLASYRKDDHFDFGFELCSLENENEKAREIAWHPNRYKTRKELDERILEIVKLAQGTAKPQFFTEGAFGFELWNSDEVLLISTKVYPSKQRATWECEKVTRLARNHRRYRNTGRGEGKCRYGSEIVDDSDIDAVVARDPKHYFDRAHRDAAKRRIYEAVVDAKAIVDAKMIGDFIRKRQKFLLVDHQSICHLESTSAYDTDLELQRDFALLLSLAMSSEHYEEIDKVGEYSFAINDKDGRSLARHPKTYSTEDERDWAMAETHFFIRTRGAYHHLCKIGHKTRVQLQDLDQVVMLQGFYQGTGKFFAREYLLSMLQYAEDASLYRDIDEDEISFGFELLDRSGMLIAIHPAKYATAEERDDVRDKWIRFVRNLALRLNRITDSYYYRLADVNQRVLLRSAINFQKEEEARDGFRALVPMLLEQENYESLYDNVGCRYTFQIVDKAGKVFAKHPIQYSLPRLRDEQILDVMRLVQTQYLEPKAKGSDQGYFIRLSSGGDTLTSAEKFSSESEAANASLLLFKQLGKLPAYSIEPIGEQHHLILRSKSGKVHALSAPGRQEELSKIRDRIIDFANGPSQLTHESVPVKEAFRYQLLDPEDMHYLESDAVKREDPGECSKFVERAQLASNYRKVTADEWDEHGFELTRENGKSFARHPSYFPTAIERDDYMASIQNIANKEGFHLVEHILLRPDQSRTRELLPIAGGCGDAPGELTPIQADPYTFRASVIVPYWPERFRSIEFRRFFEQTIRMEAPAQVFLRICWIDVYQMRDFETKLRNWFEVLSRNGQETTEENHAYNELVEILFNLTNVYPVVRLPGDNVKEPVILGQSMLGTGAN